MPSFHSFAKKATILLSVVFCMVQSMALDAAPVSYTPQILQYVNEDTVYLLEKIRKNVTIPSEKLVVEAILNEDGPQAAYLYRKQLTTYPDPSLDNLSRSRLASYQFALNQTLAFPEVVPKIAPPVPSSAASEPIRPPVVSTPITPPTVHRPLPTRPITPQPAAVGMYALQFGSFSSRENAEKLASELSPYGTVSIVEQDGMFKVRMQKGWQTEAEARSAASSIPVNSMTVPLR